MRIKRGAWNGDQVFASILWPTGAFLVALHRRWRWWIGVPPGNPFKWRAWIGPVEVEVTRYGR